ncbi:thiol peroxidase [Cellulosilyticum sp. WCF-2]|uniref:thiol peroxidase n=1 Tax=Cellulosilyticum sp. WCF-2 TaxID=2497860 RepID=UPI000F8D0C2C|nr:thiol peroxidase [Cellulosilyticum sp. WCF-2]QEH69868.1 thiol peroxidase [Cellulosilyticum sp. WCF-2]
MNVKFQGKPITLEGHHIEVGEPAPGFNVVDGQLQTISSSELKGKRVYVSVPSLDTGVCDREVRRFNEEATKLNDVKVYTISMDLPFAQARWCGAAGIENVVTLSDYKDRSFGQNSGTYIKELGLLTRAVFVIDENDKVIYVEYCEEVTEEPHYEEILKVLS